MVDFQKMAAGDVGVHRPWREVLSMCGSHAATGGALAVMVAMTLDDDGAEIIIPVIQAMTSRAKGGNPAGEPCILSSPDAIIMVSAIRAATVALAGNPIVQAMVPLANALEEVALICANVNAGAMTMDQAHAHLTSKPGFKPVA